MKEYARGFYHSKAWQNVSRLYMTSKHYVCERCGGVGVICHHKKYITPWNVNDPAITLSMDNLECLCQECHNQEHSAKVSRAIFDSNGDMVGTKDSPEIRDYKKACKAISKIDYEALRKHTAAQGEQ